MFILISPAKTLNFDFQEKAFIEKREINFPSEAEKIVKILRKFSPKELGKLMSINSNLADLNAERFSQWQYPFDEHAKPALWAFRGEVFHGIEADGFDESDYIFIKKHLRILSGLYGYLHINDFIKPYRLEMGTRLKIGQKKSLYEFWSKTITDILLKEMDLQKEKIIVNLASNEYFKVLNLKRIKHRIINIEFKDFNNGEYKMVTMYAKKARGMMVRYIAKNKIENPEDLTGFDYEGYFFNANMSTENKLVFTRG